MKNLLLFLLVAALHGAASGAPLRITAQSSVYDQVAHRFDFSISFNRVPDFFTADELGRQADAFQYWIFYNNKPFQIPLPPDLNTLIRGVEMFVDGELPIRAPEPPAVGDPYYGGWGAVTTTIPYALSDATLSFSINLETLGDEDGKIAYRLDAYEYGGATHTIFGGTAGPYYRVCEPTSFLSAATASLVILAVRKRRSAR